MSCVILTMGDRPAEVERAVRSVLAQRGNPVQVVVVGNGTPVSGLPPEVVTVELPANVGIPAGRNAGAAHATGEVVLFLDDDGALDGDEVASRLREAFASDPRLGIVSLRVRDPLGSAGARRHVPRLRAGDPSRPSYVTTFLGGASAVRAEVLRVCGGFPDAFFYAHEETDLAWRALDRGYRIRYEASSAILHPMLPPSRHAMFYRLNARNRVWLARRNLPWSLAAVYLTVWVGLTLLREGRRDGLHALRPWFAGFVEGWRTPCGPRRPMSWRTAWEMTRLGRPPIV